MAVRVANSSILVQQRLSTRISPSTSSSSPSSSSSSLFASSFPTSMSSSSSSSTSAAAGRTPEYLRPLTDDEGDHLLSQYVTFIRSLKESEWAVPGAPLPATMNETIARVNPFELLPGKVWLVIDVPIGTAAMDQNLFCWPMERGLYYNSFCADFGPYNIAMIYRFCRLMDMLDSLGDSGIYTVFFPSSSDPGVRSNCAVLAGAYMIMRRGMTAEQAYAPFEARNIQFMPFRDAGAAPSTYNLTVKEVLKGIHKGFTMQFLELRTFDLATYEHYEQPDNGDWNWIVPNKFLAFASPMASKLAPAFYIPHFQSMGITAVIRLNSSTYDPTPFKRAGIVHLDMIFADGHNPPIRILEQFLSFAHSHAGGIAVHCKAGLGRTGTLICAYMMAHYGFTADESIGFSRICRPGMVVGPQQNFLSRLDPAFLRQLSEQRGYFANNSDADDVDSAPMQPRKNEGGEHILRPAES